MVATGGVYLVLTPVHNSHSLSIVTCPTDSTHQLMPKYSIHYIVELIICVLVLCSCLNT